MSDAAPVLALAAAKVNLTLAVGPRRPDGYHDLVSVMQSVALFDELEVAPAAAGLHLEVDGGDDLGGEVQNLVLDAARVLIGHRSAAGLHDRSAASFVLRKRIPVAAGLAGGSADAAAALLALDSVWGLGTEPRQLRVLAAAVGSDVPFCLAGGTQVARGRGELLAPVQVAGQLWWVLGVAPRGLATAAVYRRFDELGLGHDLAPEPPTAMLEALAAGDLEGIAAGLRNELEPAAFGLRPSLAGDKAAMAEAGALAALLSGSGPTILGLCRDEASARRVAGSVAGRFRAVAVAAGPVPGVTLRPGDGRRGRPRGS